MPVKSRRVWFTTTKVRGNDGMKLDVKRTIIVGLAFMGISAFWQLYDFIIPLVLTNVFYASDTISGFVMSLDNILALVMLPLFGSLSDKTQTRFGKRMPFIIGGTVITVLSMTVLPYAIDLDNVIVFVIGLLLVLFALSSYRSPAVALMPDVTPKHLRSNGNAIINLMGALGGVFSLALLNVLSPQKFGGNHFPIFMAVAAFMFIGMVIMVLLVRENQWRQAADQINGAVDEKEALDDASGKMLGEVKKSLWSLLLSIAFWFMGYNAVISAFSRYAVNQLGLLESQASTILLAANAAAIIAFVPIGYIGSKLGRKRMIQLGIILLTLSFGSAFLYRDGFNYLMYLNFIAAGFGWASINVNSLPMVLELAKAGDVGRYTGLYYTFSMSAQIITPILSGLLFDLAGYRILFPYSAFFLVLSYITMTFVKHGDVVLKKQSTKDETNGFK